MNFAPYQDESPEVERALSPPPPDNLAARSKSPIYDNSNSNARSPPPVLSTSSPNAFGANGYSVNASGGFGNTGNDLESHGGRVNLGAFETSLPLRMDYEAMLAYLALPPAGGVFLLLFEHKSDYVRFHAWQSSMLFSAIFILHLLFAWSSIISWIMFIGDVALIAFLSLHAYRDVDSLDHYEVPIFGRLANSFVDNE